MTLEYHYRNGAPKLIRDGHFDVVVLQGHLAGSPTRDAEPFLEYARLLDSEIRASGARTVFFMTWPQGHDDWADLDDLIEAHRRISDELDAPVAPVGVAMELALQERPDLDLIGDDEVHATWAGAYLAAATIYATLFERSPEGLPFTFGVPQEEAAFLQRIAWETVIDWQAGTDEEAEGAEAAADAQVEVQAVVDEDQAEVQAGADALAEGADGRAGAGARHDRVEGRADALAARPDRAEDRESAAARPDWAEDRAAR